MFVIDTKIKSGDNWRMVDGMFVGNTYLIVQDRKGNCALADYSAAELQFLGEMIQQRLAQLNRSGLL